MPAEGGKVKIRWCVGGELSKKVHISGIGFVEPIGEKEIEIFKNTNMIMKIEWDNSQTFIGSGIKSISQALDIKVGESPVKPSIASVGYYDTGKKMKIDINAWHFDSLIIVGIGEVETDKEIIIDKNEIVLLTGKKEIKIIASNLLAKKEHIIEFKN